MSAKFVFIVAVMAAVAALIYGINRLSTQFHPYGNWLILVGVLSLIAAAGAWAWDSRAVTFYFTNKDQNGHYLSSWKSAQEAARREKENQ
jgi:hypothetical protein